MKKEKKFNKSIFKKTPEEVQEMLKFRGKASCIDPKKGKGSYRRKAKYKEDYCFI
jgi:stalled ribosome alternative rescue factor ArfA